MGKEHSGTPTPAMRTASAGTRKRITSTGSVTSIPMASRGACGVAESVGEDTPGQRLEKRGRRSFLPAQWGGVHWAGSGAAIPGPNPCGCGAHPTPQGDLEVSVRDLDAIVRDAVDVRTRIDRLDRTHLRALADRLDYKADVDDVLRHRIKRRLMGAERKEPIGG